MVEQTEHDQRASPHVPVSFDEFLAWCDEDTHAEWVDGEIVMMAPASIDHQDIKKFLVTIIDLYLQTHSLGKLVDAPFKMLTQVRPSGREPDILFVVTERVGLIKETYLDGPADLVVEIISPESVGRDRGEKFVEYEAAGVHEYWLIDPLREQVEFYVLGENGRYRLGTIDSDGIYHSALLTGFWLRVAWLWQRPLPPVLSVLKELGVI
jgi:Uma2 family endonuclease